MKGRRSSDHNFVFGYPKEFSPNKLPTESEIVSHTQFLKREKIASKEWKVTTSLSMSLRDVVTFHATKVPEDICNLWSQTSIPHHGSTNREWVKKKTENLLTRSKEVLKVKSEKRDNSRLSKEWGELFDISKCPHRLKNFCSCPHCAVPHPEPCDCPPDKRVPDICQSFL